MNFRIKIPNGTTHLQLPCREKEIVEFCQRLGLPNTTSLQVDVDSVPMNDRANTLLGGKTYNLDKLNYLAKRLDSFDQNELTTFYAVAYGEKLENVDSLINLTFNTHCASVVSDFSDLDATGKKMYLTERMAASPRELELLNGQKYFERMLESNPNPTVTPYGIIYRNANEYEQVFDGTHFPQYEWEQNYGCITISKNDFSEYLYLPFEETELTKALERLGAEDIHQCSVEIETTLFNDQIKKVCQQYADDVPQQIGCSIYMARKIETIGLREMPYINNLMSDLEPRTVDDIDAIFDSAYEFEMFDGVHTAEDYGRYMICESGHFEYDENLEEYINFEKYGEEKMAQENGAFTPQGYLVYHGYNIQLKEMLGELGIEISTDQTQELKLYMPLKATTYYDENEYGNLYQTDCEIRLCEYELKEYEDDILEAIERNALPEESKRGLMEYYGKSDSVNAKVKRYDFSVEDVRGELMGVATLELNAPLDDKELATIKDAISGQASDGWGEGFEQREIKAGGKEIYVSFWNSSKDWSLQTGEELGIAQPKHELTMGGMSI